MKNKQMPLLVAFAMLAATSCSILNPNDPASTFKSFEDTWTVALAAYDAHCDRVNQGKVELAKEAIADAAWNQFRASFKTAFIAASRNWSAPATPELKVQATQLLQTLNN